MNLERLKKSIRWSLFSLKILGSPSEVFSRDEVFRCLMLVYWSSK